jgi:hypothetical protein
VVQRPVPQEPVRPGVHRLRRPRQRNGSERDGRPVQTVRRRVPAPSDPPVASRQRPRVGRDVRWAAGRADWSEALAIQQRPPDKVERKRSTGRPWPSPKAAAEHFGSWNAFIAAAGLEPTRAGRRHDESTRAYTRDALILAGREWAETHGRAPRSHEWKVGSDHPSATTVRKHFGSWAEFLAAVEAQAVEERAA